MKGIPFSYVILSEAEGSGLVKHQIEYDTRSFDCAQDDILVMSILFIRLISKDIQMLKKRIKLKQRALKNDLKKACQSQQIHPLIHNFYQVLKHNINIYKQKHTTQIQCIRHCDWCCYQQTTVTAPEVFYLAKTLRHKYSPLVITDIIERLEKSAILAINQNAEQHHNTNIPCGLLNTGLCDGYNARPMACQIHHSTNHRICKRDFEQPERFYENRINEENLSIFGAIHIRLFNETLKSRQLSVKRYELNQALLQALRNPELERIWFNKQEPFTDTAAIKADNITTKPTRDAALLIDVKQLDVKQK